ncbi:MAG TPA: Holliday junction resolvase RuvX, partial [Thermoleophilia bacterium]|nr:Holliday junction resolvase RuvX [Thermoleophilia bacterium]
GTIANPLTVVDRAGSEAGLATIEQLVADQGAALVVVGLPVSLDGVEHGQARAVRSFAGRLKVALDVPVVLYDERFTTAIAQRKGGRRELDARAAAQILEDYLASQAPDSR